MSVDGVSLNSRRVQDVIRSADRHTFGVVKAAAQELMQAFSRHSAGVTADAVRSLMSATGDDTVFSPAEVEELIRRAVPDANGRISSDCFKEQAASSSNGKAPNGHTPNGKANGKAPRHLRASSEADEQVSSTDVAAAAAVAFGAASAARAAAIAAQAAVEAEGASTVAAANGAGAAPPRRRPLR